MRQEPVPKLPINTASTFLVTSILPDPTRRTRRRNDLPKTRAKSPGHPPKRYVDIDHLRDQNDYASGRPNPCTEKKTSHATIATHPSYLQSENKSSTQARALLTNRPGVSDVGRQRKPVAIRPEGVTTPDPPITVRAKCSKRSVAHVENPHRFHSNHVVRNPYTVANASPHVSPSVRIRTDRRTMISAAVLLLILLRSSTAHAKDLKCEHPRRSPQISENQHANGVRTIRVRIGHATVVLQVADDEASRETGLMCVERLPEHTGMLFVMESEKRWDFWMKNTLIPLDMIWISKRGIITKIATNVPEISREFPDGTLVRRSGFGRYIVEIPAGETFRDGIIPGARVLIARSTEIRNIRGEPINQRRAKPPTH